MSEKPRLAFWFRYGAAEHAELYHALPRLLQALSEHVEVHYFGPQGRRPDPESIARVAVLHRVPFRVDRTKHRDKVAKYLLWLLWLPWIGLQCRRLGVRAVYIDETVPLAAPLARLFFGPNVAITVADFFTDIYLSGGPIHRALARAIQALDWAAWRKLPLIITRACNTRDFLARHGINPDRVVPIYDPVDARLYHPADRAAARARFGYGEDDVVLVHHGILHPNKGNDRIFRALAAARSRLPNVRFLLVGHGPEFEPLRALAQELRIQDIVQMTGWLPRPEDVNVALNAGDIGLVMRVGHRSDDFHMTGALVHNMAVGLPILAADLGGVREVVRDGYNGFLFPPDDMDLFTRRLAELAADPSLRARLGSAALASAREHFDLEKVVQRTVSALLRLVS
ncbi:MAG: glycosyltransferase [Kiritimatiellae bacterium]|nr:glycosyltransferase [Kiritimatiellia bacterium]MDW8458809.1 glycosyltransferase [Verrucomicrobiota bacterium]